MKKSKRLLFQSALWLVVWMILGFAQNLEAHFLLESVPTFIFQVILLGLLIYYAAPKFLFKKKYLLFFLISIGSIVVFSLIINFVFSFAKLPPPEMLGNKRPDFRPSILVHLSQSLLLLIAYLLGLFIEAIWFLQKKEQETVLIKSEALQSELKLLKSQINPHFLFNTLNNIYALAVIDASKTQKSISYLSDMLRYVLYECERPFVSPQKEVKYIEDYIQLFSLKSSRQYPIKMDIQILDTSEKIAPMVLIPFVENALKHSYIEKIKNAFISIVLKVTKGMIVFEIENSIPEMAINKDEVGGIGMENVRKRLTIIYPGNHELLITEKADTFKVALTIKPPVDV